MNRMLLSALLIALAASSCKDELVQPDIKAPENLINTVWYDTAPYSSGGEPIYALYFLSTDSGYVQDAVLAYKYPMHYYYYEGKLTMDFVDGRADSQRVIANVLGKFLTNETDTFQRVE